MSRGINKVIIIGNLGGDPGTRYTPAGSPVTTINVATSESWKDKQTGQKQEKTEWHRIVFFNKLAEVASKYLKKGSKVFIEGSLSTSKWQDESGADRYRTEIIASSLQFMDSKNDGDYEGINEQSVHHKQQAIKATQVVEDDDDDVPF